MNTVTIVGRIVRQAEIATKGDVTYAKTAIASDRARKSDATDFVDIIGFSDAAGQLSSLAVGAIVKLSGSLKTDSYTDSSGTRRKSATVVVRKVERYAEAAA